MTPAAWAVRLKIVRPLQAATPPAVAAPRNRRRVAFEPDNLDGASLLFLPVMSASSIADRGAPCEAKQVAVRTGNATQLPCHRQAISMGVAVAMDVIGRVGKADAEAADQALELGAQRLGAF